MDTPSPIAGFANLADRVIVSLRSLSRSYVLARLQPGLDRGCITSELSQLGLAPPSLLVDLYAWRDGTAVQLSDILDDIHFFPGFYLLSLSDACTDYVAFKDDRRWSPGWFPIFANGGGDFYAVDCSQSATRGSMVGFMLGQPEQLIEHRDLMAMFLTIQRAFDEGVFFVDDHGYLESDDNAYMEIVRRQQMRPWEDGRHRDGQTRV